MGTWGQIPNLSAYAEGGTWSPAINRQFPDIIDRYYDGAQAWMLDIDNIQTGSNKCQAQRVANAAAAV